MFGLSSKKSKKTNQKTLCSIPEFIQSMTESSDFVSYNVLENETLCLFYYKSEMFWIRSDSFFRGVKINCLIISASTTDL
ncbi:hypothetical protein ACT4UT_29780, partial [Bacillus sp. B-TM1]